MNDPFNKNISDVEYEDIQKLLADNPKETITLDFKCQLQNIGPKIAKSIVAFANTEGGWLIFGIKENKDEHTFELKGLVLKDNHNPDDTITNIICERITPILEEGRDYNTKEVRMPGENKFIYIIKVKKHTGNTHYFFRDGKCEMMYFRVGAESKAFTYELYQKYFVNTSPKHFLSVDDKIDYVNSLYEKLRQLWKEYDEKRQTYDLFYRDLSRLNDILAVSPISYNLPHSNNVSKSVIKKKELNDLLSEIEFLRSEIKYIKDTL